MKLTPREESILTLVAEGFIDKEIAIKLKLSARTVQSHVDRAKLKLNARNRIHAATLFTKYKLQKKPA